MITSVANLLRDLMVKKAVKLDEETITHPPTIGAMYEGLTRDILDRTIPASLTCGSSMALSKALTEA
jgi:hypothetical protein